VALSEDNPLYSVKQKAQPTWDAMAVDIKLENRLCISEGFIFYDSSGCHINLEAQVRFREMQEQATGIPTGSAMTVSHQNTC
jgi:hypothetical protein